MIVKDLKSGTIDISKWQERIRKSLQIRKEMEEVYGSLNELKKSHLYLGDCQLLYLKKGEKRCSKKLLKLLSQAHQDVGSLPTVGVELGYSSEIPQTTVEVLNASSDIGEHSIKNSYALQEKSEIRIMPTNPYSFYWLIEEIMSLLPKNNPSVQICIGNENRERALPIFLTLYFVNNSCILPTTKGDKEDTIYFPGLYIGESVSPELTLKPIPKEILEINPIIYEESRISEKDIILLDQENHNPIKKDRQVIQTNREETRRILKLLEDYKQCKGNRELTQTNYFISHSSDAVDIANTCFYAAKLHSMQETEFQEFKRNLMSFLGLKENEIPESPKGTGLYEKLPEEERDNFLQKVKTHLRLNDLENKIKESLFLGKPIPIPREILKIGRVNNAIRHIIEEYTITTSADMIYRRPLEELI